VQDFLTKIPVRKQTALKNNTKTLQAIKGLLFAFAFARRDVRFSLKVLKAKNNKLNWTYAASQNADLTEIATKVLGKEVASECTPYKISSADTDVEIENGWEVEALLVSADAGMSPSILFCDRFADACRPYQSPQCSSIHISRRSTSQYRKGYIERDCEEL
jgi:hypothetical protein